MFGDKVGRCIVYSTAADPANGEGEHVPYLRSSLSPVRKDVQRGCAECLFQGILEGSKREISGCL